MSLKLDDLKAKGLNAQEATVVLDILEGKSKVEDYIRRLVYEEDPVDVLTFIESPNYLNLSKETWPSVKEDLVELFSKPYNEAVFIEGIGSGKTTKCALAMVYLLYRLLILSSPQLYYSLMPGSRIALMNMSIRAPQAKMILFGDIKSKIDYSPWFQAHYRPDPKIRSLLRFPKHIYLIPGNSSETFPAGFNLLGAVLDEAAWFLEQSFVGEKSDQAENIYESLRKRIASRFLSKGLLIAASSPRSVDDYTEKKAKEALSNPLIFVRRRSTWMARPKSIYSGSVFLFDLDSHKIVSEPKEPVSLSISSKIESESISFNSLLSPKGDSEASENAEQAFSPSQEGSKQSLERDSRRHRRQYPWLRPAKKSDFRPEAI